VKAVACVRKAAREGDPWKIPVLFPVNSDYMLY